MLPFQKKLTNGFFAVLSLPATGVGFSFSTQVAVLSWILSTKYNLHIEDVAIVWLAGPLSGVIMQPVVGMISDKNWFWGGRRKPFIIVGGILSALMFMALLKLDVISRLMGMQSVFIVAVIVALLLDISINVTFNPARSIIADVTPAGKQRTRGYAWMQAISGSFSIGAYFISIVFGNIVLLYVAAVLVFLFSIVPLLFIKEPRVLESTDRNTKAGKSSMRKTIKTLLPLYGFIAYGVFVIVDKFITANALTAYQVPFMYACIALTLLIGVYVIYSGQKRLSPENEFQKMLLAHSFTWLGLQTMFVMIFFYVQQVIVPGLNLENTVANSFSSFSSGKEQTGDSSAGNILSLGFLILNFVAAILPVVILEPLAKRIGKRKTYSAALAFLVMGFGYLYIWGRGEWNFYFGMFLCGIGWSAVISIVFAIMSEKVDACKMGLYMSLFNFSIVFPSMMTVGVSRIVNESADPSILFLVAFSSLLLSFIFWLFVKESSKASYAG